MAYHLGDVKDMEDFKQKIKKQKKLKNKTIKELQKFLPDIKLKLIEPIEEIPIVEEIKPETIKPKKLTQRQEQMNMPVFLNKHEKYEWLMKNGCTNSEDRNWLRAYKESEEYKTVY